jgi:hypothetical protein
MKTVRHFVYMFIIILTMGTMLICCGSSSSSGSGANQYCKQQNVTKIPTHADCDTYASRNGCTGNVQWTDSSFICEAYNCSSCDK